MFLLFRADADDDDPSMFEAELAMLDELDEEQLFDTPVIGHGPEGHVTNPRWSRPSVPPFNPTSQSLIFQQLDVDYYIGAY